MPFALASAHLKYMYTTSLGYKPSHNISVGEYQAFYWGILVVIHFASMGLGIANLALPDPMLAHSPPLL